MIDSLRLLINVILLGVIEGITEWLPISSTGHMLLFDAFITLDLSAQFKEVFFVCIQLGAILAVAIKFWDKIFPIEIVNKKLSLKKQTTALWFQITICCTLGGIFAIIFDDFIESNLKSPIIISIALIFYGIVFIVMEKINKHQISKVNELNDITYKHSLIIGAFQTLSIIPGTSRSGATIIGALTCGFSRERATEFSFYLAIPVICGYSFLKILKFGLCFSVYEISIMLIGMLVAFWTSLFTINFLLDFTKKHTFIPFGIYRIILGVIIIIASITKII